MSAYLVVVQGLPPQVFTLAPGTSIAGRAPGAEVELGHVEISRHHCRFIWNGEQCLVEDMGSVRGTRVNGERIAVVTTLEPGDEVAVGPAVLQFAGPSQPPRGDCANPSFCLPATVKVLPKQVSPVPGGPCPGRKKARIRRVRIS